jgi:hypothetical protein
MKTSLPSNLNALNADKHALYEESVQAADSEVDFIEQCFALYFPHKPSVLREDFCGTGWMCAEWVRNKSGRSAIGVDLDQEVLNWGIKKHIHALSPRKQKQVMLLHENVLQAKTEHADIITALNFSYWIFKERKTLSAYFRKVYKALKPQALFIIDLFGGSDAGEIKTERRSYQKFDYLWEQESYNQIDGSFVCNIHYEFRDGSSLRNAFTYDWRLWTPPEIRDILGEAGFSDVSFFLRESNKNGFLTGNTEEVITMEDPDLVWLGYLVGVKN